MRKHIKGLVLAGLFVATAGFAYAQSGNPSVVSKDVNRFANKKAYEQNASNVEARSVAFPAIVYSKGIAQSNAPAVAQGNMVSKGYPTWAISKGVARHQQHNMKKQQQLDSYERQEIRQDADDISKRK